MNKFAGVFAVIITFVLIFMGVLLVSYFPEESGIVLTLSGLLCAGISMLLISKDSSNKKFRSHDHRKLNLN